MAEQQRSSADQLEGTLDGGIDAAMAAKGAIDAAKGIGTAAAEAGSSAATSAASSGAGAGAGASAGAGTGAAAGTAAGGPVGTVIGAVAGMLVGLLIKPAVKALVVVVVFTMMIFSSLPSMFWENPVDVADNTGPLEVYTQFRDHVSDVYTEELEKHETDIERDFEQRVESGEFDEYEAVELVYTFGKEPEDVLSEILDASALIISMFEVSQDDWRTASFKEFKKLINSTYFWNDALTCTKESEELEVVEIDGVETAQVHITYSLKDVGIEAFRGRIGMTDDRDYIKAVEMAYNTRIYFGEIDELPMGGITGGNTGSGGVEGSYPGGGTHNTIRQALRGLENPRDFFGGAPAAPLPAGSWYVSSEFGPRNYAPDPIHTGIDLAAAEGTPVYSVMDGQILLVLDSGSKAFGKHIVVYHGGEVTTMYAHLSAFGSYNVGDTVKRGAIIGYVGNSGLSTGHHLHFENQKQGAAHNPRTLLPNL